MENQIKKLTQQVESLNEENYQLKGELAQLNHGKQVPEPSGQPTSKSKIKSGLIELNEAIKWKSKSKN